MTQLRYFDGQAHVQASEEEPYPVKVAAASSSVVIKRELRSFGPVAIPGIAAADALDAGDQMGTVLIVEGVPPKGSIVEMRFHDLDDEGIDKLVYVFSVNPTLAASDAAFALGDQDNLNILAVFSFALWRDNANNQLGLTANTPADYTMDGTTFYIAVQTLGADNIAAGAMPQISFVVEVAQ